MKFLLDTHLFLWALCAPSKIAPDRRREIETSANTVFLSSISIVEIMIKVSLGRLKISFDPVAEAGKAGFVLLDFRGGDALGLGDLPFHHKDPFDRMLIAQARSRKLKIMTDDPKFQPYGCALI